MNKYNVYTVKDKIAPKHDKKQMVKLLIIVKKLNKIFHKNHYFHNQIKPFTLVWSYGGEWFIACDDHYTYSQDKRFRVFKKTVKTDIPFSWVFHLDIRVWRKEVFCLS